MLLLLPLALLLVLPQLLLLLLQNGPDLLQNQLQLLKVTQTE